MVRYSSHNCQARSIYVCGDSLNQYIRVVIRCECCGYALIEGKEVSECHILKNMCLRKKRTDHLFGTSRSGKGKGRDRRSEKEAEIPVSAVQTIREESRFHYVLDHIPILLCICLVVQKRDSEERRVRGSAKYFGLARLHWQSGRWPELRLGQQPRTIT